MKTWEQQAQEGQAAAQVRKAKRRRIRPFFWASMALGIFGAFTVIYGLFLSPIAWLGYLLIISAGLIDRKQWICGACGNHVERTSSMCPVCRCHLS